MGLRSLATRETEDISAITIAASLETLRYTDPKFKALFLRNAAGGEEDESATVTTESTSSGQGEPPRGDIGKPCIHVDLLVLMHGQRPWAIRAGSVKGFI